MNLMHINSFCITVLFVLWPYQLWANDNGVTRWVAETSNQNRFAGTLTIIEDGESSNLEYTFVYNSQIISTNHPETTRLKPLSNSCWQADITGSFLPETSTTVEVVFCERDDSAYWLLIDKRGGAMHLPNWVSFAKLEE